MIRTMPVSSYSTHPPDCCVMHFTHAVDALRLCGLFVQLRVSCVSENIWQSRWGGASADASIMTATSCCHTRVDMAWSKARASLCLDARLGQDSGKTRPPSQSTGAKGTRRMSKRPTPGELEFRSPCCATSLDAASQDNRALTRFSARVRSCSRLGPLSLLLLRPARPAQAATSLQ